MGTGHPHVEITAATLAGGENNQDRYAYGDGWAFVLDGASSFATTQPGHDGGWYAERLKKALIHELTSSPDDAATDIVARAIEEAATAHDDPETCPTSTIALARWTDETVEAYVLGDSTVALIGDEDETVVTDVRLANIASPLRDEYRSRLAKGSGFDERHLQLLQQLQAHQAEARNRPGGYWIAGARPEAAHHAELATLQRKSLTTLVIASDGAAACLDYGVFPTWHAFASAGPAKAINAGHEVEADDATAIRWPRSKSHDDKAAVSVFFH